jgi:hypothetical protein
LRKCNKKVASDFVAEYQKALTTIRKQPFFRIFYKDFRGYPLKKYPFIVFYQIQEKEKLILVKSVFHTAQNPDKYNDF